MKFAYSFLSLTLFIFAQNTAFAGGKSALLKALAKDAKSSRLYFTSLGEMDAAMRRVDPSKAFIGKSRTAIYEESASGLEGKIHSLSFNGNQDLNSTVIRVPKSPVKPVSTKIWGDIGETHIEITGRAPNTFVQRNYETVTAKFTTIEGYAVEYLDRVPMRVQNLAMVDTGAAVARASLTEQGLEVTSYKGAVHWSKDTKVSKGVLRIGEKYPGKLIGVGLDPNSDRLTIQLAEGPNKITERYFQLSQANPEAKINFTERGFKELSAQEIKDAGFLAYVKTLNEKAPARSMIARRGLEITR